MRLLKVTEVMEKLSVSRGKAYKMVRDGVIPSVEIDGCIRVPEEALDELIQEQLRERNTDLKVEDSNTTFPGGVPKKEDA